VIDWLTICARLTHSERIIGRRTVVINEDGEVEWQRELGKQLEGSWESRVLVWSHRQFPNYVHISGNPAKFFQGHNVFGSNDVRGLVLTWLHDIAALLRLEPTAEDVADWERGNVGIQMIDVTESWQFDSREQVRNALRALEQHSRLAHRGRGTLTRESTLYWGKHSRRWALKAYCKGDELEVKKHRPHVDLPHRDELLVFADKLLRFELRMLPMELERVGLATMSDWTGTTPSQVHSASMAKLEISEAAMLKSDVLDGLSPRLQLAYQAWLEGHDLRTILPARTFYRYRKQLLAHGVDVALVRPRDRSNVIPLRVVLHGRPVSVPDWAIGTSLYFDPSASFKRAA